MATIDHLTEAGLLRAILPHYPQGEAVEIGPGDDAAVLRLPSNRLAVTTDSMVEGHDFLPGATLPQWIGRKAAVQNLADVAAMGAEPLALVVAISAPRDTDLAVLEGISAGLAERSGRHGASVVGGDLGRSDRLTVTVTALGTLPEGTAAIRRDGARPGDVLAIGASLLGLSAAGLALILAGRVGVEAMGGSAPTDGPAPTDPDGSVTITGFSAPLAEDAVRWHDAPGPDLALGWTSGRSATAMIDLSDGLVRDGGRIGRASGVVLELDREALAPDADALRALADEFGTDPWAWVLHGAEEHAMLATFEPGEVPPGFRVIGRVRPAPESTAEPVTLGGAAIEGAGFDHFA